MGCARSVWEQTGVCYRSAGSRTPLCCVAPSSRARPRPGRRQKNWKGRCVKDERWAQSHHAVQDARLPGAHSWARRARIRPPADVGSFPGGEEAASVRMRLRGCGDVARAHDPIAVARGADGGLWGAGVPGWHPVGSSRYHRRCGMAPSLSRSCVGLPAAEHGVSVCGLDGPPAVKRVLPPPPPSLGTTFQLSLQHR